MQLPTISGIRVRTTEDAHLIFHAVNTNLLPMVQRRLGHEERKSIQPGSCYVWEERGPQNDATGLGIERWTDGYRWGPSRVRDDFLFYHEKEPDPKELMTPRDSRRQPFYHVQVDDMDRMIKQTYSVFVCDAPASSSPGASFRKWHLTAYFTRRTVEQLNTVDDFPILAISCPPGLYKCARVGKHKKSGQQTSDSETVSSPLRTVPNISLAQGPIPGRLASYSPGGVHTQQAGPSYSHSYATSPQGYSHHRKRSDVEEYSQSLHSETSMSRSVRPISNEHYGHDYTTNRSNLHPALTKGSPSRSEYDMPTPSHTLPTCSSPSESYGSSFAERPNESSAYSTSPNHSTISQSGQYSLSGQYSPNPPPLASVSHSYNEEESTQGFRLPPIHVLAANAGQDSWAFSSRTKEDDWAIARLKPGQTLGRKGPS